MTNYNIGLLADFGEANPAKDFKNLAIDMAKKHGGSSTFEMINSPRQGVFALNVEFSSAIQASTFLGEVQGEVEFYGSNDVGSVRVFPGKCDHSSLNIFVLGGG